MEKVGLNPDSKKKVGKYSLGMKQRLGIAQAIMEHPYVLILDEPMNGLDDKGIEDIRKLILSLRAENRVILISSHNKEDIRILCDKVFMIYNGKVNIVEEEGWSKTMWDELTRKISSIKNKKRLSVWIDLF